MAALREIVAKFDIEVNDKPLTELDKKIALVNSRLMTVAGVAAASFAAMAAGLYKVAAAAGDVAENQNVLAVFFGEDSLSSIDAWSREASKRMNRGMYDLQDSVGRFGAFLSPQLQGTKSEGEVLAMSEALAERATDLSSLVHVSQEEAQMRLLSGLQGDTEAIRRLGIDLSDEGLNEFSKKNKGLVGGKQSRQLTQQEKTLLRYLRIFEMSTKAHGDAEKTADSFANQIKGMQGRWRDLSVALGKKYMPYAEKALKNVISLANWFGDFFLKTDALTRGFGLLTAAMAAYAWRQVVLLLATPGVIALLAEQAAVLWANVLPLLKLTAAFLVLEDVYSFFEGKDTFFGRMVADLLQVNNPLQAFLRVISDIRRNIESMLNRLMHPLKGGAYQSVQDSIDREQAASNRAQVYGDEAGFSSAVQKGDIMSAYGTKGDNETNFDVMRRFADAREAAVKANPALGNAEDVNRGLALQDASKIEKPVVRSTTIHSGNTDVKIDLVIPESKANDKKYIQDLAKQIAEAIPEARKRRGTLDAGVKDAESTASMRR